MMDVPIWALLLGSVMVLLGGSVFVACVVWFIARVFQGGSRTRVKYRPYRRR